MTVVYSTSLPLGSDPGVRPTILVDNPARPYGFWVSQDGIEEAGGLNTE